MTKVDYGIDAPGLVRMFFLIGAGLVGAAVVVALAWNATLAAVLGGVSIYPLGMGCFMLHASKVGKLARRERLLDLVSWSGNEQVLDVGCGRGLMMIGAAKRLTTGKAIGIDLWKSEDQSGNDPEATIVNARLEGVAERVEVQTADMRSLSFGDETFDVIVSHWAVHNLYEQDDRKMALEEMVRVLKPRGHLLLADIEHHDEYVGVLRELGVSDAKVIENGPSTRFAAAVSFGSYRPATVYARK